MKLGVQAHSRVLTQGTFVCPSCRADSPYERVEARRWLFVGVAVAPLQRLGEWIRCTQCEGAWDLDVLEQQPEDAVAFRTAVLQAMIGMMTVDGRIDDSEVEVIRTVYLRVVREDLDEHAVRGVVADLETLSEPVEESLRRLAVELGSVERELVFQAAWRVAMADGVIATEEGRMLERLSDALGFSDVWLKNFLSATNPALAERR